MTDERKTAGHVLRLVGMVTALAAGAVMAVVVVYIAYVYALWARAMHAEGSLGAPPP